VEWTDQRGQQSRGRSRPHRGFDTSGLHGDTVVDMINDTRGRDLVLVGRKPWPKWMDELHTLTEKQRSVCRRMQGNLHPYFVTDLKLQLKYGLQRLVLCAYHARDGAKRLLWHFR